MSITRAMWSGVSGLSTEGQALGVIGDNVANSNTIGFKYSRAMFEDVLGGAMGQNIGAGVHMSRAQQIFAQGTLQNTGQPTDLALTGDGFFVVKGNMGGVDGQFYTRAGNFVANAEGFLVNPQGMHLQGYLANPDGTIGTTQGDIQIPTAPIQAKATTELTLGGNLDANATVPITTPFDANDPTSYNASQTTTVYDSLGNAHDVTTYFVKTGANTWDAHSMVPGEDLAAPTPGLPFEVATAQLTFDGTGALLTSTVTPTPVDFGNGATPGQSINLNLGTPAPGGTGLDGITQSGKNPLSTTDDWIVAKAEQDGYASGTLAGVNIDESGTVMGTFSNGQEMALAQVAVAKFASNDGLGRAGHNMWMETRKSGAALLGPSGTGGRGAIVSGALEQSNVDLTTQFVDLISHQRAFQANSKTITTADEMLQELVNLKR